MDKDKLEEFEKLVKPLVDYINDNYDPYTIIVVEFNKAEIKRVEICVPFEVRD